MTVKGAWNDGKPDIAYQGFHYCQPNLGAISIYHNDENCIFSNPINMLSSLDGAEKWLDFGTSSSMQEMNYVAGRQSRLAIPSVKYKRCYFPFILGTHHI